MLIENYEHLAKSSQNHKNLATNTADKQQQQQRHDHVSVFFLKLLLTFKHNFHQSQPHRYRSSFSSSIMGVLCVISLSSLLTSCCVDAVGYSYTRFIGPVAGPEHRIYVNDNGGHVQSGAVDHASRLDYVAKPEYEFAYGVEDADAHILHNRNEMRDGDDVKGVYSVVDPDGTLRVVKYTANDANGFQAEVITNGVSSLHGGQQQHHHDVPSNNYHNNYQPQISGHPSNVYTPNLEHINHYYPQNLYPTSKPPPPPTPIIYQYNNNDHYNNNNNNNNDDVDNDNDYNEEDYQPQYEVHEKQNDKDHKVNNNNNNNDDSGNQHDDDDGAGDADDYENADDDDGGNKKKGKPDNGNKKKKGHNDDNSDDDSDGDDDDDYDDDSEELADYDEAARSNEASDEYY